MRFDRLFHLAIPALCCLLAIFLGLNGLYLFQLEAEVREKRRFETAVLADALRFNTSNLERLVARSAALNSQDDRTAAKRAYGHLTAALKTWKDTDLGTVGSQTPLNRTRLEGVLQEGLELAPLMDRLDDPASTDHVLLTLQDMETALQQVNEAAGEAAAAQLEISQNVLLFHQRLQSGLLLVLIAGGLAWIFSLQRRNAALKRDNGATARKLEGLARRLDYDGATGLMNNKIFTHKVSEAIQSLSKGQTVSVYCIGLETRLPTTGSFDQGAEDVIFAAIADLLRHAMDSLGGKGCLARSGGKGFYVMAVTGEDFGLAISDISNRIHALFLRPVATEKGAFLISPAIGQADTQSVDQDAGDLIRNAELAVADALANGRRRVVAFQPAMRAEIERREIVESALARAIEANECLPHFQPQFNLKTGRVFGVEALARWYHSELGWISPSEFIPIAESNGDIVSLGWKILETACNEVQLLPADLTLSVNLSVAQILSDDVVAMLDECLERTGLPATRLKLEVTEATMMSDLKRIQATLTELRSRGIRISLDDFGVGYSALAYLTEFHWDEIKIDRSFASKAVKDRKLREVLKLVLGIAETMGSEVLIEGIETVEQRDVLVELGCKNGQGYLFGGPMAIDDITTLFFPGHKDRNFIKI